MPWGIPGTHDSRFQDNFCGNNGRKTMIRKMLGKRPFSFQGSTDSNFWVPQGSTTRDFKATFVEIIRRKTMIRKKFGKRPFPFQGSTDSNF